MENRNDDTIFDESQEPLENGVEIDSEEDEITSVRRELYILKQEINNLDDREISQISDESLVLFLEDLEYFESFEVLDNEVSILKNKVISFSKIKQIYNTYDELYSGLNVAQGELTTSQNILNDNIHNIKSEILTMMGLFFAIFTFIQINFSFLSKFLENYNGFRVMMFAAGLNIILMTSLYYIMALINVIVTGKDSSWDKCEPEEKILKYFNASKTRGKRNFFIALGILGIMFVISWTLETIGIHFDDKTYISEEVRTQLSPEIETMKKDINQELGSKIRDEVERTAKLLHGNEEVKKSK